MSMQKTGTPERVLRDPQQQREAAKSKEPTPEDLAEVREEGED